MKVRQLWYNDWCYVLCVTAIALMVRLNLLFASHFVVDADEAIVGLMAKHIVEGRGVPVFYYGQHYMGSFEALCVALGFFLFGVSGVVLKLIPLLFALALIPVIYQLCLELAGRNTARLAALFIALPPMGLVEWSSKARGGFIEILVLGALSFLYGFRFFETTWSENRSRYLLIATSLILGLGWWINNQIIYFVVPFGVLAICWCFKERSFKNIVHAFFLGLSSFFVGSAPYWLYNFSHDFISFEMFQASGAQEVSKHWAGLFSSALPILFGAKRFWHDEELFNASVAVAYFIYGALLLFFFSAFFTAEKRGKINRLWLLFPLTFVVSVTIFAQSAFGHLVQAPRYLIPLYVVLMPFAAFVIVVVLEGKRITQYVFGGTILALNVASVYLGGLSVPGEPLVYDGQRVQRDHTQLIQWLDDHHITLVRTNYWIGYKLAFETEERVRFTMYQDPYQIRMPEYEELAKKVPAQLSIPIIAVSKQAIIIQEALRLLRIPFKTEATSGYVIFYDIDAPNRSDLTEITPSEYTISTNTHAETIQNAHDGDIATRWGSGRPQSPDMEVRISFKHPQKVERIILELGKFGSDAPRKLEVDVIGEDGKQRPLLNTDDLTKILYFIHESDAVDLLIPSGQYRSIILKQVGKDPVFDWSIAELKLFSP